ncbi:MAG: rhamnulokinase [Clostridium sp.]|nr:rhamnulokinase [Clostridium sp.]
MGAYYLAVDIGASSGRHILGHLEKGILKLEEIHRFRNEFHMEKGEKCWDLQTLFGEIKTGMKKCKEAGKIPASLGVDAWGVDFVLLDEQDRLLGNAVSYRDSRTCGMDEKVYRIIPEEELYARTGIQKAIYNTVYQLMAVKETRPEELEKARTFLMVPDYFHYLLTSVKANEYTEATTSQLVHPETKDWDTELLKQLGYPARIFQKILTPGTILGGLSRAVQGEVGFGCKVVLPASHDTGSAVLAVPSSRPDTVYISSGTWSLMGVERRAADCSLASKARNFTNEGGYQYRFRYLKNIMGLWMIQSVKKEFQEERGLELSFGEICEEASRQTIPSLVDCNDDRFLAPANMCREIQAACLESVQPVPVTYGELASVVYNSLAKCYADTMEEIQAVTGKAYDRIHVVGGGANADYLNELTARYTGCTVCAGPVEATAIGNLMVQMIANGEWKDLDSARRCVLESFAVKTFRLGG